MIAARELVLGHLDRGALEGLAQRHVVDVACVITCGLPTANS